MELAQLVSTWSEDESRKVGAVIVGQAKEVRSLGFNGLPRGISAEHKERFSKLKGEKYHWFEHAERNAIYNAARAGSPIEGAEIYCTLFPCSECLRGIIQSGLLRLHTFAPPENDPHYARSFEVALEMSKEADLELHFYN